MRLQTRAIGVTEKNDHSSKQHTLGTMAIFPELVDAIYIKGNKIMAIVDGEEYHIGNVTEYIAKKLSKTREYRIKGWQIIGGYPLKEYERLGKIPLASRGLILEIDIADQ